MSVLLILLLLLIRGEWKYDTDHAVANDANHLWSPRMLMVIRGANAAASPLSGTKRTLPWESSHVTSNTLPEGYSNIPTFYDVRNNADLTKLLDVGACIQSDFNGAGEFSYVPPLDGTNPDQTFCQNDHGMRFVLFDLQLVNVAEVDSLSGSFTAQLQLVFHWMDGWEVNVSRANENHFFAYGGSNINSADDADACGFVCDTTLAANRKCCDEMWVPQLQIPTCKVNGLESVVPPPYLRTTVNENTTSFWNASNGGFGWYNARRMWYVGLDVTCPFKPEFRNFPYDYNFLTIDIVNPYSSRTWLQLNKGFLDANIIDSIAGIDLSPDKKIDGWRITDLIVSSACGTQQTWKPTFLTQDYLLQILGVDYRSQSASIKDALDHLTCAKINNLNLVHNTSLSNPTNKHPYYQTKMDYRERLNATITRYVECISKSTVEFAWNTSMSNGTNLPIDINQFKVNDPLNINRSFNFLDFEFPQDPNDGGVDFRCVIEAIANLTTPGIRINIITQRFKKYYFVKLFVPTFVCVAFAFFAFALKTSELLGRLTVVVPSAIALSTLQGFVVSTDIPAIAYTASTTWVVLASYGMQLLIALESVFFKFLYIWDERIKETCGEHHVERLGKPSKTSKSNSEGNNRAIRIQDLIVGFIFLLLYFGAIILLLYVPHHKAEKSLESRRPVPYESI